MEERLNQAVDDGVITAEQKEALSSKFAQLQQKREQHQAELEAWFKEQGIDPKALTPYGGFGHHMGFVHLGGYGRWHMGM